MKAIRKEKPLYGYFTLTLHLENFMISRFLREPSVLKGKGSLILSIFRKKSSKYAREKNLAQILWQFQINLFQKSFFTYNFMNCSKHCFCIPSKYHFLGFTWKRLKVAHAIHPHYRIGLVGLCIIQNLASVFENVPMGTFPKTFLMGTMCSNVLAISV